MSYKFKHSPEGKAYAKKYYNDFRKKLKSIIDGLKNKPCTDCKGWFSPHQMDFDHIRDKKYNIGQDIGHFSLKTLLEEIAKCELVCANCHRERTHRRLQMDKDTDYSNSDLGYQSNTAGPGKERFKPKRGKDNAGGNAPRQDGVNSKRDQDGQCGIWKQSDSEGKN